MTDDLQHSPPAFIAADVGGTHARLALVRPGGVGGAVLVRYASYRCADWPGLDAIVAEFLAEADGDAMAPAATHAVLACAGVLHGDDLLNTNLPWRVSLAALRDRLRLPRVDLINDFEALAHAVPTVSAPDSRHLIGPDRPGRPIDGGAVVVMGPGTGLGCAAVLPDTGGRHRVLATEAGHIALAAGTRREAAVVGWLAGAQAHVPVERVLSGPGLMNIYTGLAAIDGVPAACRSPSDVTSAARAATDDTAVEAVQLFCAWLGSFSADLALLYGATGGVLLAGGFLSVIDAPLRDGRFEARFLAKGALAPWLRQVPVRLLDHGRLGVIGAARWSLARDGSADRGSAHGGSAHGGSAHGGSADGGSARDRSARNGG